MPHVLFICGKGRMRSPTAADIVSRWHGYSADFAGLSRDADVRVSADQVVEADVICVMEARQRKRLVQQIPAAKGARIVVLDVPDRFAYGAPDLIALLNMRLQRLC